jgi:hypothetical protein
LRADDLPDLPLQRPARLRPQRRAALEPCPDCGGTMVANCCDGLTACNDPTDAAMEADAADERRYRTQADERPE